MAEPVMNPPPVPTGADPARAGAEVGASDRRLAEAILDSIVEAILVFDPRTRLVSEVNHGATRFLGVDRDELIGRPLAERFPAVEAARFFIQDFLAE